MSQKNLKNLLIITQICRTLYQFRCIIDRQNKKDEALDVFNKCLEFDDIHGSSKEILHLNVGNLCGQTLYNEAIENYNSSLKIIKI